MSWREEMQIDLAKYLGLPEGSSVNINDVEETTDYYGGCDTCGNGGGISFSVEFYYTDPEGKIRRAYRDIGLGDFLRGV